MRELTVGSLFAGIGGFDLGFERAGFTIRWQVEISEFCRRVLAKHWPDVQRYEDVRKVGAELERIDVIVGGFPCKQTSVAAAITGRRVGLAGADSGLWRHMLRIIRELRPSVAVVENPDSTALDQVSRDLADFGGRVSRHPCTVSGFGGPHLRRRVFVVADFDGAGLAESRQDGSPASPGFAWPAVERNSWLSTLAGIGRVDDGVPGTMDRRERIEACGNAVVPVAAEWIARQIRHRGEASRR